jgi:hypothetical protein
MRNVEKAFSRDSANCSSFLRIAVTKSSPHFRPLNFKMKTFNSKMKRIHYVQYGEVNG